MDYTRKYKSFFYSQYVTEGLRITAGVLTPALLMGYFHLLATGISISLGALFVSVADGPGPILHRKNGMGVCVIAVFIVTFLAGFAISSAVALTIMLALTCFFFSMLGVYGARAASIGTAAMLALTLSIDPRLGLLSAALILKHSLLLTSGGVWYMCFSMLLYNFRPYRLAQQTLGDYIEETSKYMVIRGELYRKEVDYDSTYKRLLHQQVIVQNKQTELNELLFKTRSIVKDTSLTGRTLVLIYLNVTNVFERIMMSYQKYPLLHKYFDETGVLNDYYLLARELGHELSGVGIAVKSGVPSLVNNEVSLHIIKTREKLDDLRLTFMTPDNIEGFISLRGILENIEDLSDRLRTLHTYTLYDKSIKQKPLKETGFDTADDAMTTHQEITPALLIDNLTLKSDTFRHALRMSIAMTAGHLTSLCFSIGHSYWVLLTIVVILKPAFSLTQKRNTDRILGTLLGILIGMAMVYAISSNTALLILLILFMAASYSFFRINYFVSVLMMTAYLALFYHFLYPRDFTLLIKDRVIDTLIGSAIAVSAGAFLFPSWEREKIKALMVTMLMEAGQYFSVVAGAVTGKEVSQSEQRLARKNALVALANLSEAFNRMLSEPKRQQQGAGVLYKFVVLLHTLTSYIATLYYYKQHFKAPAYAAEFSKVADDIIKHLGNAVTYLEDNSAAGLVVNKESLRKLNEDTNELLQKRKQELEAGLLETKTRKMLFEQKSVIDQLNLIYNAAVDITKISKTLKFE